MKCPNCDSTNINKVTRNTLWAWFCNSCRKRVRDYFKV